MRIDRSVIDFLDKKRECDDVVLFYEERTSNLSRFAENRITQNMSKKIEKMNIKAVVQGRIGSAVTTLCDRVSLLKTLRKAEEIASNVPEDPEFMPPLLPQKYKDVQRESEGTVKITPLIKAKKIFGIVDEAKKRNASVAGYFSNEKVTLSILNTKGFFCSHSFTNACFSITVIKDGSSGFAEKNDENAEKIDERNLFEVALLKAERGKNPIEIAPGNYPVFLEPQALARLMIHPIYLMDKRAADEGWSFFSGKEGKMISSSNITLFSDPFYPENPSIPFDISNDGIPLKREVWIKNGVLNKLWTSRYWAKKNDIEVTGFPSNVVMEGENKTGEEIIKDIDYGLLVTRLWYIRFVNQKELILTGMTRDGLFLIENGRISRSVKNLRFNDSPFTMLSTVKYIGRPERIYGRYLVPPIFASRFHFASSTQF